MINKTQVNTILKKTDQMTLNGKNENNNIGENNINDQKGHKFQWKVIHHSWIFWAFSILMLIGILYFIVSLGFVVIPHFN
jgi:intergrase/recombinase